MDGQGFSREVAFSQSVINIGADQGNDIVLRGSSVADFHVLMHYDSGRWSISSLNGAYRTTVNGRSLDVEGTVLQNGSIVEIGTYRLTMMLNGVNTDIIIQSQSGADVSMSSDNIDADQNIQLEITKMDQTELEAGSAVEMELTVTNAGPLVANMQLQLQGIPSAWVQIIPPVLNLNEGRKGTFLVRISPPRNSSAQAGLYNMHFVAISPNYPQNTGIADTALTILPYSEFLISGPAPMQLKLSRGKQTDIADVVVINSSNATGNFFIQSRDDSNELNFAYQKTGSGGLAAGQEVVTVRPGDSVQIPMEITAKKIPFLGISSKHHHYYTNVTPSDRPGDAQTIAGEVVIHPTINTMLLLLILALLIIAVGFIFQPYIHQFECQDGRRSQVIVAGSAAQLNWNVSGFASTITLNNGQTDTEVSNSGSQYVNPTVSTTYTLTAENFISSLLHLTHKKTVQVLVVPSRPAIDVFSVDKGKALYDETVTLNWSVEPNATAASITSNKSTTQLAPENYTGKLAQGYQTDTLISLKAQNDSGYDLKSLFINVASDAITLNKFTVWVRPNGIAIPEDNDVRRTTRWGSLQMSAGTVQPARSGASGVNPQPAAQSNTLEIPDNFNSTGAGTQLLNPEVMAASGQTMPAAGSYSYQPPAAGSSSASAELLVSPALNPTPTPVPTAAVPEVAADSVIARSSSAPVTSPEGSSSNRDFTIKLAEVIEDPLADSGYRVIEYFPNYVLQKQEQILVEWSVDGVPKVKIENLSGDDLQNTGGEYAYPEKSTTYTLTAQVGETKKAYSLPVNVAGDPDDGEGSGLKCELKANAATLKVPGSVMLTWTGGGNNRVQLISSTQAEKENDEAEKKKEEEAKAKGEKYEKPKDKPLTGGTIGDYLQPSGFMRVNVDKQTTFVLNAYDASNNVICTKSVEVKYEGGNDKKDIKLRITKIADENGVSQAVYGKGQMVSYTVALTDFVKGTDPTGAIAITDGTSTCSVNWPVNTCSFQAKKAGDLTITAVYAGDDNYKKVTATAYETVIDKMPTSGQINSAIKPTTTTADVEVELMWDHKSSYGMVPTGIVTLTTGSTSCDVDMETETMTCAGDVDVVKVATDEDEDQKKGYTAGSIYISVKNMGLKDATPDRVTAAYKGDAYFMPSTSQSVLFRKINTQISIVDNKDAKRYPYKPDANHADLETLFSWGVGSDTNGNPIWGNTAVSGRTPTGTISFILTDSKAADYGKCEYDLTGKKFSCEGTVKPGTEGSSNKYTVEEMLLANPAADRVRAEYSGDSIFNASKSATVLFHTIPTALKIIKAYKYEETYADLDAVLLWDNTEDEGKTPSGTIKFTTRKGSDTVTGTCELDLVKKTMNCEPGTAGVEVDTGKQAVDIVKLLLTDKDSDRVKAEYSGDSFFEASESTIVLFTAEEKIDTDLVLSKASKDSEGEIRLLTNLTWDTSKAGPNEPGGIIVYTSGQATCTLNIPSLKFDKCSGKAVLNEDGTYQITGMVMDGKPGDTIYAEYKGDIKFNGSVSASVYFSKDETTLDIESATKINDIITTTVVLDPAADPTGTITFTSGTATCVLDITDRSALRFEACSGNAKFENGKFVITGMEMNGKPGDSIYAKYSGDGAYEESTSPTVTFISPEKTDTVTVLNNAYMTGADLVSFDTVLSWDKEDALVEDPTGTITFTIGSDTCKLNVEDNDFDCEGNSTEITGPEKVQPAAPETDVKYTWKFKNVQLKNTGADGIKAVYSGDDFFNPSSSEKIKFVTVETELEITEAQKSPTGNAQMKIDLTWIDEPPAGKTPQGTLKLTSGSKTCTLDIKELKFDEKDCAADQVNLTQAEKKWTFEIRKLGFGSKIGSTVSAKYSGDGTFLPSSAANFTYTKLKTELEIEKASKHEELFADINDLILSWDTAMSDGKAPTGTVTLTFGSDASTVCKLEIKTGKFDCSDGSTEIDPPVPEPTSLKNPDPEKPGWMNLVWTLKNVLLKNKTADRVKADYSGDNVFEASSSLYVVFHDDKIDTTLDLDELKKTDAGHADLKALLSWDKTEAAAKLPAGTIPTGTITFTIGSQTCKLSFDDESEGHWTDFTCSEKDVTDITASYKDDGSTVSTEYTSDDAVIIWTLEQILLSGGSAPDRVKAEYSGDANFNASTSKIVLFQTIPTTLKITDADKTGSGLVNLTTELSWTDDPLESGKKPAGTIKLTAGSAVCTLNITGASPTFTDCNAENVTPASDPKKRIFTIEGLKIGDGTGDSIKADYSGDGLFLASSTDKKYFDKLDTVINIDSAVKKGNTVDLTARLTPAGNETGTIVFTSGSGTCTLKIDDHANPVFEKCSGSASYNADGTIEITGMHLSAAPGDSIYAEYSGDSKYNKSTSPSYYFEKVDTNLDIEGARIADLSHVGLQALLSWDKTEAAAKLPAGTIPTGTVTFTIGSSTCKLSFDDESEGHWTDFTCFEKDGTVITPSYTDDGSTISPKYTADDAVITWAMEKILLSGGSAPDRVKAEYSGDANFNASTSKIVLFPRVETQTRLNNQVKMPDGRISVDLSLSWMQTPPDETMKPTGTIKFTSGTGSCTLDISSKQFTGCSGEVSGPSGEDKTWTYTITDLKLGDGKGESIKAEYSGDALFLGSSSNELFFTKVDTELEIITAFKPNDTGLANTVAIFSWDAEKAANRKPAGTVKYTVGSGSCTLDLSSAEMDCDSLKPIDISTYSTSDRLGYRITIENMALSDTSADSIKAEYSGDPVFNASTSRKVPFKTVDTEIIIRSSYKPDEKHLTATAELDWDEAETDGRMPRGIVKFQIGSGSCTLTVETSQLSCDPGTGTVSADRKTFKVKDMLVDDSSADRISAEYSGDGFFNPSKSVKVLIGRIDTEITIPEAYKSADAHVSLKALLSWDESIDVTDEDPLPTGTLKVTVGDKMFTYDLETKELTPEGGSGDENAARQEFTFTGLPFDDIGAETVKVEYSGDRYYGPSSVVHTFDKIQTETVALNYYKGATQDAMDKLTAKVIPEKLPFDESEPRGPFDVILSTAIAETQYTITCPNIELNGQVECEVSYYYPLYLPHPVYMKVTKDAEGLYNIQFSSQALGSQFTATVRYKGDTIFKASQYDYEYNESEYKNTETWIDEAIQLSNGHKYVKTTVRVPQESSTHQSPSPTGKFVLTASNGKSCWFVYESDHDITTNCGDSFAVETSYGSYYNKIEVTYYLRGIAGLGEEELSSVSVVYEGSETLKYHGSASDPKSFTDSDTGPMTIESVTTSYSGEVTATVYMVYTKNKLLDDYGYPAGPLVITKGNYTCTIPLKYGTNSGYTLDLGDPSVSEDCGGGTVNVRTETISDLNNKERMILELRKIPVSDHVAPKFRVSYIGDGYYKSSDAEEDIHNRVNSNVRLSLSQENNDMDLLLTVSTADAAQTAAPSGTMDISFKDRSGNSVNHCVWDLSGSERYFNCDIEIPRLGYGQRSYDPGSVTLINWFNSDHPFPTGYASAELSYSGDENYNPSSGAYPLPPSEVVITPLTDDLYDDGGRLYFNTNANSKKFPKFPEIFKITDCDVMPGECRVLKNEIPLKVSIRVKDYYITDTRGHDTTAWPFSEDIHFTSGSDFDVSCTPIYDRDDGNDRLYTCEEEAGFSTTGIKHVQAGLVATWLNNTASAEFPEMIAVKVPDSPLYGTTLIIRPETNEISAGSAVDVEADTTYNGTSIHPSAVKNYIYYTWTGVDAGNTRIAVCPDSGSTASCTLDITDDTKWIVAEFLGNDTYAPSTGLKSVGASPVTLGIVIGGGG